MTANLLSRLQGLTSPDTRIDAEIYASLGSAPHTATAGGRTIPLIEKGDPNSWPAYTASLDAAVALCERVLPGYDWIVGHTNGGLTIYAQVGQNEMVFGETPAIALLIAILTALEARDGTE